ncbi:TRAP transporter small permease, partial [Rhizobiaceae sp. 2RAB30]
MTRAGAAVVALSARIDRVCLFLAKAALVGMVCVIMLQVISRYGLRQPPAWTEELARYLMVWGGLLGATAAFRRATDPAVVQVDENARDRRAF